MGRKVDLTGQRFGKLVVVSEVAERDKNKKVLWSCLCDCGTRKDVSSANLRCGNTKSCGCITTAINLVGQRFGLWTVIEDSWKKDINGGVLWTCVCKCGERRDVSSNSLRRGRSTSCGCVRGDDLTGEKFGRLEVMRLSDNRKRGDKAWLCQCSCGNKINVITNELKSGHVISCGCARGSRLDLRGKRFGRLTVLNQTDERYCGLVIWKCQCDCGKYTNTSSNKLMTGHAKSCGCLLKRRGPHHPNYNPNLTDEERIRIRGHVSVLWSQQIMKRDNYTCQVCGDNKGGNLNSHHLNGWNAFPEQRFDLDNGVTLCTDCHKEFHSKYGYGDNTREQFDEYAESKTLVLN